MSSFALFRYPDEQTVHWADSDSEPVKLRSIKELRGKEGFVLAPFMPSEDCSILLLESAEIKAFNQNKFHDQFKEYHLPIDLKPHVMNWEAERQHYAAHFNEFHKCLMGGNFRKIVLSRCSDVATSEAIDAVGLFMKACFLYPHQFIALFSSSEETWLMATPELLVGGDGNNYKTVALAGTQQDKGITPIKPLSWSAKDREEQQLVARYIADILNLYAGSYEESSPHTVKAANLFHLRSDFDFTLREGVDIVELINALHPTPAVCGLPKRETNDFILKNETHARRYYSGFSGVISQEAVRLYVSLRCMEIGKKQCRLYAGGGLLPNSHEEEEWKETTAKLQTMYQLLEQT